MASGSEGLQRFDDPEIWDLEGPYGPERWFRSAGRFNQVEAGARTLSLDPADGDLERLCTRNAFCEHPGPWPFAFHFCPDCGRALRAAPLAPAKEEWSAPFGATTGFPENPIAGNPVPAGRRTMPMPAPASLGFVAAGTPSGLFAYDFAQGWVYRWTERQDTWHEILRAAPCSRLPRWSWSAAAFPDGFALPTNAGPTWIRAEPNQSFAQIGASSAGGIGAVLGGAARMRSVACIPIDCGGKLALALWSSANGEWRGIVGDEDAVAAGGQMFAVPVSVNSDAAFWAGERGQLFVVADRTNVSMVYRAWPDQFRPLLGVRPVLAPDGTLYQLGRIGEDKLVFETLTLPGATPQRHEALSYSFSCGSVSFREGRRYRLPWTRHRAEYVMEDGQFIAPLLAFDENRFLLATCSPRNRLADFIETGGHQASTLECRIAFTHSTRAIAELGQVIRAGSIWDIVPFVFHNHVYIYNAVENECCRWPLTNMAPNNHLGG